MRKLFYLVPGFLLLGYFTIGGCSSDSSVTDFKPTGNTTFSAASLTGGTVSGSVPATVVASITPSSGLSALGTATVSVTVKDAAGAVVADGTTVTFTVSSATLGSITPTATTVSGIANATFTAGNIAGTEGITVKAGTVSASASITILGADVGSIQFVSATPNVIGLKGSGQAENSVVTFSVNDVNGQPVADGTSVIFTLSGPQGGEALNPLIASTSGGLAKTTLQSGTVAGPVRIAGSTVVRGVTISSSSTGVSIGGGLPSYSHFSLVTNQHNLAGLNYVNLQSTISAFLADRFGNFNVLQGTSVSFYAEGGAVDRNNVTDATGATTVTFRTQDPLPVHPVSTAAPAMATFTGLGGTGNPLDGISTVIAATRGEECFTDSNGNGVYDGPVVDAFPASCDLGEPYIDANNNGQYDAGEFFVDANSNGVYDGPNGTWDGDIMIWRTVSMTFSGAPTQILNNGNAFVITSGNSRTFTACVADGNGNSLMAGSTIAVTTNGVGTLSGSSSFTLADIILGPTCFDFILSSATDPATVPAPGAKAAVLTITVTWNVTGYGPIVATKTISGTVQ